MGGPIRGLELRRNGLKSIERKPHPAGLGCVREPRPTPEVSGGLWIGAISSSSEHGLAAVLQGKLE